MKDRPSTIEEAAEIVYKPLCTKFKKEFVSTNKQKACAQFHSTMGRAIRNKFGLWTDNKKLLNGNHPDNVSWCIMELVYDKCFKFIENKDKN